MKKILFAASECAPFVKTGGLGTVVGSLCVSLKERGLDVRVILPDYACIDPVWKAQMKPLFSFPVTLGWRKQMAEVRFLTYKGVTFYFLSHAFYFEGDHPYGDADTDIEKFCFFCKAVLAMLTCTEYRPDVIHCHDWQSAMIPVFLKSFYKEDPYFRQIATVLTIHNLRFQGVCDLGRFRDITGLSDDMFTYDKLEHYGCADMLKGGITYADKITTVSETYAREIKSPPCGEGLSELLTYREKDISGIINGIDCQIYDPASDDSIPYHYDEKTFFGAKKKNKIRLQKQTQMPVGSDRFAACIVSRLTTQKGLDLLEEGLDAFLRGRVQLYVSGSGEEKYETLFLALQNKYPDKIYFDTNYSDPLAKQMYAGCDITIMPSLYEPCGLSQLMALRYGTVPVVRLTGGLRDTVKPWHEGESTATGFGFSAFTAKALEETLAEAVAVYETDPASWKAMVRRGMTEDFSWNRSSGAYEALYDSLCIK